MATKFRIAQLFDFAGNLGLRTRIGGIDATYTPQTRIWEGMITLGISPRLLVRRPEMGVRYLASQLAHELGHYLIAPKSRRRRKDYGIPPDSTSAFWTTDETKARIVEHYIRAYFGDPTALKDPIRRFARNRRSMGDLKAIRKWWQDGQA